MIDEERGATLAYTNSCGDTYYLHEGRTKNGKPRYFVAKTVRDGALSAMPNGYEFSESINGVVSVRRIGAGGSTIADGDLSAVRGELARHAHLARHRVEAVKNEIVVFEPQHRRYDPVLKFVPAEDPGHYAVHRMTYRGDGGWSWPLTIGPLNKLVRKYVRVLGTEGFYELM